VSRSIREWRPSLIVGVPFMAKRPLICISDSPRATVTIGPIFIDWELLDPIQRIPSVRPIHRQVAVLQERAAEYEIESVPSVFEAEDGRRG
jgi:hypothetical protein